MTDAEAWALIKNSTVYQKSNGNFVQAWTRYAVANPRAAEWLYRAAGGDVQAAVPSGVSETAFGRGMRHFALKGFTAMVALYKEVAPPPGPPPLLAHTRGPVTGAISVEASAMHDCENANQGLWKAGVNHVAFQIWPIDESVLRNHKAFREQGTLDWFRSRGFMVGGFVVNYFQPESEARNTIEQLEAWNLTFLVSDIERHKADLPGGSMELTTRLASELRATSRTYPIWFIGYGQHSAPSVVNHKAMDDYAIDYIDECYDENGYSDGVVAGIDKITREKRTPADIALGNKSLANDAGHVHQLRGLSGTRLRDAWLWRPETGEAQHDLAAGIDLVP